MPSTKPIAQKSLYAGLTAKRAAKRYRWRIRAVLAIIVALAMAGFGIFETAHPDHTAPELVLCALALLVVLVPVEFSLVMRENARLAAINTTDLDPAKLLQVIRELRRAIIKPRALVSPRMECALLLNQGSVDEARALLPSVAFNGKRLIVRLSELDLGLALARWDDDAQAVRQGRDEVRALLERKDCKGALQRQASLILASADFYLALAAKDFDSARDALARLRSLSDMRITEVVAEYRAAQLAEAEGDLERARAGYQAVAANEGTLALIAEARTWLEQH